MSASTNQTTDNTQEVATQATTSLPNNGIDISKFILNKSHIQEEQSISTETEVNYTNNASMTENAILDTTEHVVVTNEDPIKPSTESNSSAIDPEVTNLYTQFKNGTLEVNPTEENEKIMNDSTTANDNAKIYPFPEVNENLPYNKDMSEHESLLLANLDEKLIGVDNSEEVNICVFVSKEKADAFVKNNQEKQTSSSELPKVNTSNSFTDVETEQITLINQPSKKKKKKKQTNQVTAQEQMVERDVSALIDKFDNGKKNKPKQQAVLLVPANRPANSYLRQAFSNPNGLEGEDGVDFINVSYAADTRLGSFLDINAHTPFEHPEIGKFESVGGVWYYIKSSTPDEAFRFVWGDRVRNMGKRIIPREVIGFRTIIADATWVKIISDPGAMEDMAKSTAVFKNFYYYGPLNLRKAIQDTSWYVVALEEIRRTLKLRASTGNINLQPDFVSIESNHTQR